MRGFFYPRIKQALDAYADERNLTMTQMAARLNMAKSTYYNKIRGITTWTLDDVKVIAGLTKVPVEDLIAETKLQSYYPSTYWDEKPAPGKEERVVGHVSSSNDLWIRGRKEN